MATKKKVETIEIGTTGLQRSFGQIMEEFLIELRGPRGILVYKEMSNNDAIVGAFLFAIEMLMRQVIWTAMPKDKDKPEDVEAAKFITEAMDDMSHTWQDFMSEIMSMLIFGWSYFEIVFKVREDGKIGWKKIPIRSQDTLFRWEFDNEGGIAGMVQRPPFTSGMNSMQDILIPIEKSLLFRTVCKKNNPEGRSILRNAYRPWYFKKHIEQIEGIGIERDLVGLPVAHVPPEILSPNAKDSDKALLAQIKEIVKNVRRDEQEGLVFPLVYDKNSNVVYKFELLATGGNRQFDTNKIKTSYAKEIAMTVLADFILLGHERVGSFALAESKTSMFAVAIGGWLDSISAVLNRHAVVQLLRINAMPGSCIIEHGDIETQGLDILSNFINRLVAVGAIIPDDAMENSLRAAANLPLVDFKERGEVDRSMNRRRSDSAEATITGNGQDEPVP